MGQIDRPDAEDAPDDDLPEISEDGSVLRSGESVRLIQSWLANRDLDELESFIADAWEADLAWLLEQLDPAYRAQFLEVLRPRFSPEILTHLNETVLEEVVAALPPAELARALADLDSDDVVDVILKLDDEDRDAALRLVGERMRAMIEEGLTFPEYSAGRLMQREIVTMPPFWTVSQALAYLRASRDSLPERFQSVWLIDPQHRPVGEVETARLVTTRPEIRLESIRNEDLVLVPAERDQEEVAFDFRRLNLHSAPVVDRSGRMLGIVTLDDMLYVVEEEATADILALGGVNEQDDISRDAWDTTRRRFPWLAVNLGTAFLASSVVGRFSDTIDQVTALAVLMPIVAGMGGNAGTQSLTVSVRGLATKSLSSANALRVLWREIKVGLSNGGTLGLMVAVIAFAWFQNWRIAVVLAIAMLLNMTAATTIGTLVPLLLNRLKVDPAVGSGVLLTAITDSLGFFVFLGLATLVLT